MAVPELRNLVAQYMRDSDLVGTMLNSLPLHTLFQDTSLLTLRGDPNHNVNIFAEAIGLGATAHLIVDEIPIILAHHRTAQHYMRSRIIDRPWHAPKRAKRARIDKLRRQNEND